MTSLASYRPARAMSRWTRVFMRCTAVQSSRNSSSEIPVGAEWSVQIRSSPSPSASRMRMRTGMPWATRHTTCSRWLARSRSRPPGTRLVEGEAFPLPEAQLLEGGIGHHVETVHGGDDRCRLPGALKRARVHGDEGMFLELPRGCLRL